MTAKEEGLMSPVCPATFDSQVGPDYECSKPQSHNDVALKEEFSQLDSCLVREQEISCIEWRAEMTGRRFVSVLGLPFVILYSPGSVKVDRGDRVIYVTKAYLLLWCVLRQCHWNLTLN